MAKKNEVKKVVKKPVKVDKKIEQARIEFSHS